MIEELTISRIFMADTIRYTACMTRARTNRPQYALFFKLSGETVYTHAGKDYRSDSTNCILLPKGIDYSFSVKELGPCYAVEFDILDTAFDRPQLFRLTYPEKVLNEVEKLIRYWNSANRVLSTCMYELYRIFSELYSQNETPYEAKAKAGKIAPSISYLEKHYLDAGLSNSELAGASGISEVYFRKIFTKLYGLSPNKYVIRLRVKKAEELLLSDYSTMEDIALSTGFTNVYHFMKTFKSVTGCTPTEYAKKYRESEGKGL